MGYDTDVTRIANVMQSSIDGEENRVVLAALLLVARLLLDQAADDDNMPETIALIKVLIPFALNELESHEPDAPRLTMN